MTFIETDRLVLRTWREDDRAPFALMNADPDVMEFFPAKLDSAGSDALYDKIQAHFRDKGYGLWAVEEKADGAFSGFIGFYTATFPAPFTPCVEIGWRLRKESWGKGLATEGALACLPHAFNAFGFKEIYSFTSATNRRSERVMVKIGLRKRGEFDHPSIQEGNSLRRHVLYGLNAEEYRSATSSRGNG
jgi:[ribosomal protein S5]-alanine N-acetyltransferase